MKPIARKNDLVVQQVGKESLVYDLEKDKAFCLSETSVLIWELCDGDRSIVEISNHLRAELNTHVSDDFVNLALDQLGTNGLLEESATDYLEGFSRREVIRKVGFATIVALPTISMVAAPPAVSAQSGGFPLLSPCTMDGECASGNCTTAAAGTPAQCCIPGSVRSFMPGHLFYGLSSVACANTICCSASAIDRGIVNRPGFPGGVARECECAPF